MTAMEMDQGKETLHKFLKATNAPPNSKGHYLDRCPMDEAEDSESLLSFPMRTRVMKGDTGAAGGGDGSGGLGGSGGA